MIRFCVLIFILPLALCESFMSTEVHPSVVQCSDSCYKMYGDTNTKEDMKCSACCAGCRYLAIIGLQSENQDVKEDASIGSCRSTCEESFPSGENLDACNKGCELELDVAKLEITKLENSWTESEGDFGIEKMMQETFGLMEQLFGTNAFFRNEEASPTAVQVGVEPTTVEATKADMSGTFSLNDLLFALQLPVQVYVLGDEDENSLPVNSAISRDNGPPMGLDLRREFDNGAETEDGARYDDLRAIWRDRNTVQMLLILSITACLLAVLWMLCNSSVDPIVSVRPAVDDKAPPAYEVLFKDEKKMPILFVADLSEDAGPLPLKVPQTNI